MRIVHHQQQRLWGVVATLILVGTVGLLATVPFLRDGSGRAILLAVAALLLLLFCCFDRLHLIVTTEDLRAGFLLVRTRIPLDAIEAVDVLPEVSVLSFGGCGWRFNLRGEIGYIARPGPGVRIRARTRRRPLIITCDRPEEAKAAVLLAKSEVGTEASR